MAPTDEVDDSDESELDAASADEFKPAESRRLLTLAVVVFATIPAVWIASRNGDSATQVMLIALFGGVFIFILRVIKPRTPWPYASPVTTLAFFWFLMYGVFSVNKFIDPSTVHAALAGSYRDFHYALAMIIASTVLVAFGYFVVFPAKVKDPRPRILTGNLSIPAAAVIYALSVGARAVQFVNKQFGYLTDAKSTGGFGYQQTLTYLAQTSVMVIAALALEILLAKKAKTEQKVLLAFILFFEVGYAITVGFKGIVLLALLPLVLVMLGLGMKFPLKSFLVLMGVFVLIAPGNYAYRESVGKGRVDKGDFVAIASTSLSLTFSEWSRNPGEASLAVVNSMTRETSDSLENVALIINKTPRQYPYLGAEDYKQIIPRALFPRFLWKDKPLSVDAGLVTSVYRGDTVSNSGAPAGIQGDLYMRTGMNGLVIGSLALGLFLGLYCRLFQRFRSRRAAVLYATVLGTTLYNAEIAPIVVMFIQKTLVYGVVVIALYHGDKWASTLRFMRGDRVAPPAEPTGPPALKPAAVSAVPTGAAS